MILNETPIRTSNNFGINNIELKNFEIPQKIGEFDNITISGDIQNFDIADKMQNGELTYGIGKDLENQVYGQANKNIKIETKNDKDSKICIEYNFDEENLNLVDNIEIIANSNSNCEVTIKYMSEKKEQNEYHNGIIKLKAQDNAKIDVIIVNMLNESAINFISIENEAKNESEINYTIVDFGGKTSISNYYCNLIGQKAKNNLNTIYLGTENQLFDINYIVEVRGEMSETNIEVQGALKDHATKNFKGDIDFKKGAKKSKGNENEFCMLLSDTAKSKALPTLLCTEEDVEGSHSTATGKADEDMLFYIMSRGISKEEAMKLIVKARFNGILQNIKDEELNKVILEEIDKRLS